MRDGWMILSRRGACLVLVVLLCWGMAGPVWAGGWDDPGSGSEPHGTETTDAAPPDPEVSWADWLLWVIVHGPGLLLP